LDHRTPEADSGGQVRSFCRNGKLYDHVELSYVKPALGMTKAERRQRLKGLESEQIQECSRSVEFEELVRICEAAGRPKLYEIYRRVQVLALLGEYSPRQLFKYLLVAEKEWNRFHPCPEHMRTTVDKLIQTGGSLIRGMDKENRPIVWIRESLVEYMRTVPAETYCAYTVWMACTAAMLRPQDVPFITLVFDEKDRKPLNYNLEASVLWTRAMSKLATPRTFIGKIYVASPNRGSATVFKVVSKLFPRITKLVTLLKHRSLIFDVVSDPRDVPDYFGTPGTPARVSTMTVGDYKNNFLCNGRIPMSAVFNGPLLTMSERSTPRGIFSPKPNQDFKYSNQWSEHSSSLDEDPTSKGENVERSSSALEEQLC